MPEVFIGFFSLGLPSCQQLSKRTFIVISLSIYATIHYAKKAPDQNKSVSERSYATAIIALHSGFFINSY